MNHDTAMEVASEVEQAIKHLKHLYISILVKENGIRQVVVRKKGETRV